MWSMSSLEKWSWNGCGKLDPAHTIRPDSGSMLAVMAITGRNQNPSGSDPACLLGLNAVRVPQEDIKPSLALRERSVERGSPQWSSLKGWERTITKWMNIGTASKATLGNFWQMRWSVHWLFQVRTCHLELNWTVPQHFNAVTVPHHSIQLMSLNTWCSQYPRKLNMVSVPLHLTLPVPINNQSSHSPSTYHSVTVPQHIILSAFLNT